MDPESSKVTTILGGTALVCSTGAALSSVVPSGTTTAALTRGNIMKGADSPATSDNASTMAAGREARTVRRVVDMAASPLVPSCVVLPIRFGKDNGDVCQLDACASNVLCATRTVFWLPPVARAVMR